MKSRPFIGSVRFAPSGADVSSQFDWSTSKGAILHLPHGASHLNCFSNLFKSHVITHITAGISLQTRITTARYPTDHYISSLEPIRQALGWLALFLMPRQGIKFLCSLALPGLMAEVHPTIILEQLQALLYIIWDVVMTESTLITMIWMPLIEMTLFSKAMLQTIKISASLHEDIGLC